MAESQTVHNILIVEDNDFVRIQTARYLTDAGFRVFEAARGDHALDMMGLGVSLAIVDVRMEPVDGFEFIRSIRSLDFKTPVILMTGDHNPDLLNEAGKWGVSAVLIKPVPKDRLIRTVTRTMQLTARASSI